jgi:hypothetical protein
MAFAGQRLSFREDFYGGDDLQNSRTGVGRGNVHSHCDADPPAFTVMSPSLRQVLGGAA